MGNVSEPSWGNGIDDFDDTSGVDEMGDNLPVVELL